MSKKKVLLRGVFINRDTNGEGVLKVGTTLIRVSTVMGILYIDTYIYYRYFGKSYRNTGGISQYLLLLNLYPLDNSVGIFYRKDFEIWLKLCLIISTLQQN